MQIATETTNIECGLSHTYRITSEPDSTLIFMVHGKAGNFKVMWLFDRSLPENVNILAPQANIPDPLGGFSWWLNAELEDFTKAAHLLDNFLTKAIRFYKLKPVKIIAIGFSQGGAVLSVLSQLKPELFSAVALLSSFYIRINEPQIFPEFFIAHGRKDDKITFKRASEGIDYLSNKTTLTTAFDDTAHKLGLNGMRELKNWLNKVVLDSNILK
jgi:predicted esterase